MRQASMALCVGWSHLSVGSGDASMATRIRSGEEDARREGGSLAHFAEDAAVAELSVRGGPCEADAEPPEQRLSEGGIVVEDAGARLAHKVDDACL